MPDQGVTNEAFSTSVPIKLRGSLRGHESLINWLSWSHDGKRLATGSNDWATLLWDVDTGRPSPPLGAQFGHIYCLDWSPDGQLLAVSAGDDTIRIWETTSLRLRQSLRGRSYDDVRTLSSPVSLLISEAGHSDWVRCLAWSPDGRVLASGSRDTSICLWDTETGQVRKTLPGHSGEVIDVAWSPDGRVLASGSEDKTIRLWDGETGKLYHVLPGHYDRINSVVWSPDGRFLASASADDTIRYWDFEQRRAGILEGHTNSVSALSFSSDGRFLASKSQDNTIRLWRTDTWEAVSVLSEATSGWRWERGLAFSPTSPLLASLGEMARVVRIWELDFDALLSAPPIAPSAFYRNAKVVLAGDTGVGKTGLGLVLTGQDFVPTESTHGRQVWTFDSKEIDLDGGRRETRETVLWDLAGQPGYRLIHQLHLTEAAVALILFDARSETDPFAGVRHWDRALRQAQRALGETALSLTKFLVAARTDRGGISVSRARIKALLADLNVDRYFETSAKEGWQICELAEAIRQAINWEAMPRVTSTVFLSHVKSFLLSEKHSGRLLATIDDLYRAFRKAEKRREHQGVARSIAGDSRVQFESAVGRVESRGLIRKLSFGGLVLLQPELLDAYASAIINAAKAEPDGLGCLAEEDVRAGRFPMSSDERIGDKRLEALFLIATIEDLLHHEIALRESTEVGPVLVFPSQLTREHPTALDPEGKAVVLTFEGAVLNIYTTLAVRLARSGLFEREQMWKNAAAYRCATGGTCGMSMREIEEGCGELCIWYTGNVSREIHLQFEKYIEVHLTRRAIHGSVERRRVIRCLSCGLVITEQLIQLRLERRFDWVDCPVCGARISLTEESKAMPPTLPSMDRSADVQREREIAQVSIEGKAATNDFDVFLCYDRRDKPAIREIARLLKERGILPWLDEWELQPGRRWEAVLEEQMEQIKAAAVFVGRDFAAPWQDAEMFAFLRQFVKRGCPIIPVVLLGARTVPELPVFLRDLSWVDFRQPDSRPLARLIWGITGKREELFLLQQ